MTAVGIDGCSKGWIAVAVGSETTSVHYLPSISSVSSVIPGATVIAIDIPIGFPESGYRACDIEARVMLGPRRSSLFFTPVRAALEAEPHAAATRIAKATTGKGMSQQAYALRHKIFEVDRWLPSAACDVREAHPEVSFRELMGAPATASKKTWAGMVERRDALAGKGITLESVPPEVGTRAAVDDVLDAAVVAWTAQRILDGAAYSIPMIPEIDADDVEMAIWV